MVSLSVSDSLALGSVDVGSVDVGSVSVLVGPDVALVSGSVAVVVGSSDPVGSVAVGSVSVLVGSVGSTVMLIPPESVSEPVDRGGSSLGQPRARRARAAVSFVFVCMVMLSFGE
jgi:hypothetical protein